MGGDWKSFKDSPAFSDPVGKQMTSEHIIDFKRGDTFELGGQVLGADDIPIDITNYVIKSLRFTDKD